MTIMNEDPDLYYGFGQTELEARAYASVHEITEEMRPDHLEALGRWPERSDEAHLLHEALEKLRDLLLHHGWEPPVNMAYNRVMPRLTMQDDDQIDWSEVASIAASPRA